MYPWDSHTQVALPTALHTLADQTIWVRACWWTLCDNCRGHKLPIVAYEWELNGRMAQSSWKLLTALPKEKWASVLGSCSVSVCSSCSLLFFHPLPQNDYPPSHMSASSRPCHWLRKPTIKQEQLEEWLPGSRSTQERHPRTTKSCGTSRTHRENRKAQLESRRTFLPLPKSLELDSRFEYTLEWECYKMCWFANFFKKSPT